MTAKIIISFLVLCGACDEDQSPQPDGMTAQKLVINANGYDHSQYTVQTASALQNNAKAGALTYVYVDDVTTTIEVNGPAYTAADGYNPSLFFLDSESIKIASASSGIFEVHINGSLSMIIDGDDFEEEIQLARVELEKAQGKMTSTLYYTIGSTTGVAHDIHAIGKVGSTSTEPSDKLTYEYRLP